MKVRVNVYVRVRACMYGWVVGGLGWEGGGGQARIPRKNIVHDGRFGRGGGDDVVGPQGAPSQGVAKDVTPSLANAPH
jgi:hypothetical protein